MHSQHQAGFMSPSSIPTTLRTPIIRSYFPKQVMEEAISDCRSFLGILDTVTDKDQLLWKEWACKDPVVDIWHKAPPSI